MASWLAVVSFLTSGPRVECSEDGPAVPGLQHRVTAMKEGDD